MSPMNDALLDDVIGRVRETLSSALKEHLGDRSELGIASSSEEATPAPLARAVAEISAASGQAAILECLLAGCRALGSRAALFVLRDGRATGWKGAGFDNDPDLGAAVSESSLDLAHPTLETALSSSASVEAEPGGEHEVPDFGQMIRGAALVVPFVVRGQSAAVLYADSADPDVRPDRAGIEVLVTVATLSVERGAPAPTQRPAAGPAASPAGGEAASERSASQDIDTSHPFADQDDDPEAQDARRFARLLMDEICLYHSDRVEEARREGDMLVRLSDEIEKARRMYAERVVEEVRARGDFFDEAVLAVLCAGEASALGTPQGTAS